MEFAAGGELYDYLSERKVLSEDEARRVFRQIATAVYYCHKHKICHRDLKLENILLDEHGSAKVRILRREWEPLMECVDVIWLFFFSREFLKLFGIDTFLKKKK